MYKAIPHFSVKVFLFFTLSVSANFSFAYEAKVQTVASTELPAEMENVGLDEKLGHKLDLNLSFTDSDGSVVRLKDFFDGKTPVIISPVYFSCPGLCNFHLNGLTEGLKGLDWTIGNQFKVLSISFDSKETPAVAAKKKLNYLKVYGRAEAANGWHFLTGDEQNVKAFTSQVGFNYKWIEEKKEWSHASAAILVSPDGTLTRYLPGIMFQPKDLRLAINEATQGKVGTFVDALVLYCFQYNPHVSQYTIYAFNLVKVAAVVMVVVLLIWLIPVWRRARKEENSQVRSV